MVQPSYPGREHPIGYVELQSSWVESEKTSDQVAEHIRETIAKTLREQPHLQRYSARMEFAADGAGIRRANLYLGFAPKHVSSEPLNPRNMNEAPLPQPGMIEPTDGIVPMGYKEEQFGRGT